MCGSCGTVSEKGSDFPEPGATARSQSVFVALSPQRRPEDAVAVGADVGDRPPASALAVAKLDRDAHLVARRVATPDADGRTVRGRPRTGTGRPCSTGFGRAFSSDARMEVETALVRARARPILQVEPRDERHARDATSGTATQPSSGRRDPSGPHAGRGGLLSQPNSVTQNWTGCAETTWWSRTPALQQRPASAAGRRARRRRDGSRDRTGRRTCTGGATRRRSGRRCDTSRADAMPFDRQSSERMKASGADRVPLLLLALRVAERVERRPRRRGSSSRLRGPKSRRR